MMASSLFLVHSPVDKSMCSTFQMFPECFSVTSENTYVRLQIQVKLGCCEAIYQ